jgi:hypothetical protein
MKIFIPSYNRPTTHRTAKWLENSGHEWYYVLHDQEQADMYMEAGLSSDRIIQTGIHKGLGGQRWWIDEYCGIGDGEWYIQMDDNVFNVTKLHDDFYDLQTFQHQCRACQEWFFNQNISPIEFLEGVIWSEMIPLMESEGIHLGGFASTKNSFFRGKKFTRIGAVIGKVLVIKKNPKTHFDPNFYTSDDYQITAEHLLHFGKILRNNYVYPDFPRYMVGGLGSLINRQQPYAVAAQQLIDKYGIAYRINYSRKDMQPGSAVKLKFSDRGQNSLNAWRRSMGVSC